jgi:hypothetical protein
MNIATRIIGSHAFFFPEGNAFTVPSAGTSGATAKPGAGDTGWVKIGEISSCGISKGADVKEQWAPLPGTLRLKDVIETKPDLTLKLTVNELSALAYNVLFRTLALTSASTQFNPLEGKTLKGWLKLQQYDQNEALVMTLDVFVHLTVDGEVTFAEDIVDFPFSARVLHSTLNTAALT